MMNDHHKWAIDNCICQLERFCGDKEVRPSCMLARCCSICPSITTCSIVCAPLKQAFDIQCEPEEV